MAGADKAGGGQSILWARGGICSGNRGMCVAKQGCHRGRREPAGTCVQMAREREAWCTILLLCMHEISPK